MCENIHLKLTTPKFMNALDALETLETLETLYTPNTMDSEMMETMGYAFKLE